MHLSELLISIVVLVALWYMGWLRPTGLWGRSRAKDEEERRQDVASNWLKKDAGRDNTP